MTANTKMMTVKEQNKALNKTDVSGCCGQIKGNDFK